jgi:hypothetical protein
MSPHVEVTSAHMERAYAQMRKHDTPPLDVLRSHYALFLCITGRARGLAEGRTLPPEPTAMDPPLAEPPKPPPQARRRDDRPAAPPPFDIRAAQSGEYAHRDEESEPT